MRTEVINSGNSIQTKQTSKRQAQVNQMQNEFLIQLSEGREAKEAFYNAITSSAGKKQTEDVYLKQQTAFYSDCKQGFKITPQEAKEWLEVISLIGPLAAGFFNWLESKLPHNENPNNKQLTVQA